MALDSEIIKEKLFNILRDETALLGAFNFNIQKKKLFPNEDPNKVVLMREFANVQEMRDFLTDVDKTGFDLEKSIDGLLSYKLKSIGVSEKDISKLSTSMKLKLEAAMYAVESEESDQLFIKYKNKLDHYKKLNNHARSPGIVSDYKKASQELLSQMKDIFYESFNECLEIIIVDKYAKEALGKLKKIGDNLISLKQRGLLSRLDYNQIQEYELNVRENINRTTEFYQWSLYDEEPHVIDLINDKVKNLEIILEEINHEINKMEMIERQLDPTSFLPISPLDFQSKLAEMGDERLTMEDRATFKEILNDELKSDNSSHTLDYMHRDFTNGLSVRVVQIEDRVLVSIVPDAHLIHIPIAIPKETIKNLVESVLKSLNILNVTFDSVYVSACVDVQGRTHANAFVKCAGETNLSQWEPQDTPLLYVDDDNICNMLNTTVTTLFEHGVREGMLNGRDSADAKKLILNNTQLKELLHDEQYALVKEKGKLYVAFYHICLAVITAFQKLCSMRRGDTTPLCEKNNASVSKEGFFRDAPLKKNNLSDTNHAEENTEPLPTDRQKPR